MSEIILLEPLRSALSAAALHEGYAEAIGVDEPNLAPSIAVGRNPDIQRQVLEVALFYDQITLVNHETDEDKAWSLDKGIPYLSHRILFERGLAKQTELQTPPKKLERFEKFDQVEDWWTSENESISVWREMIISQMMARGKLRTPEVFDLVRAARLGHHNADPDLLKRELEPYGANRYNFDIIAVSTLNEIEEAERYLSQEECDISVNEAFELALDDVVDPKAAGRVKKVVLEELLECELRLPTPTNLAGLETLNAAGMTQPPYPGRLF